MSSSIKTRTAVKPDMWMYARKHAIHHQGLSASAALLLSYVSDSNNYGSSPAQIASAIRAGEILPDPAWVDPDGRTLLHVLLTAIPLNQTIPWKHESVTPVAQALVDTGVSLAALDNEGRDALDMAFFARQPQLLADWLPKVYPDDPSGWQARRVYMTGFRFKSTTHDENEELPWVHAAVMFSNTKHSAAEGLLAVLDRAGADWNQRDCAGRTPLFWAASPERLAWLLEHGADPTLTDDEGKSPVSHWSSCLGLGVNDLQKMISRLPKTGANDDTARIEEIFTLLKTSTLTTLKNMRSRLALVGDERLRGQGVMGVVSERLLSTPGTRAATAVFHWAMALPGATTAATHSDRVSAFMAAISSGRAPMAMSIYPALVDDPQATLKHIQQLAQRHEKIRLSLAAGLFTFYQYLDDPCSAAEASDANAPEGLPFWSLNGVPFMAESFFDLVAPSTDETNGPRPIRWNYEINEMALILIKQMATGDVVDIWSHPRALPAMARLMGPTGVSDAMNQCLKAIEPHIQPDNPATAAALAQMEEDVAQVAKTANARTTPRINECRGLLSALRLRQAISAGPVDKRPRRMRRL